MDPITQGAIGAAAAQAVFGRRLPRGAALIGFAAGMAADLDIFIPSGSDPVAGMIYHRQITHSLIFIPLGGLLSSLLFVWWKQFKGYRREVIGAAIVAYATHGLLDAFTSYGTLLFWPFSNQRIAWDLLGIVDPMVTVPLLIGMFWTIFASRPRAARIALMFFVAYVCFGGWQHYRASSAQRTVVDAREHVIEHGRVMPAPGALVMWRSVYRSGEEIHVDGVRVPYIGETLVRSGGSAPVARFANLPEAVQSHPDIARAFEVFTWFADGFVTPVDGNATILGDQRFSADFSSITPLWGMDFGTSGPRRWRPTDAGRGDFAARLWRSLIYREPGYRPVSESIDPSGRGIH
jgi:inner membrane protein